MDFVALLKIRSSVVQGVSRGGRDRVLDRYEDPTTRSALPVLATPLRSLVAARVGAQHSEPSAVVDRGELVVLFCAAFPSGPGVR